MFKIKNTKINTNRKYKFSTVLRYCTLIAICTVCCSPFASAQFRQNSNRSLFSDVKAIQEGDALTILIIEDTEANNGATTETSRSSELSAGLKNSSGTKSTDISGGISSGNTFSGKGSTSRSETIRSKLSARVTGVDEFGNLQIEGTRTTKVNGENQKISIKGSVRPVDVMNNNSVYSYNILDLTLLIEGDGTVSKIQEPGLITKFLRFLF